MKIKISAIALALLLSLSACSVAETENALATYKPTEAQTEKETESQTEPTTEAITHSKIVDGENDIFTEKENGNVVTDSGIEYTKIAIEGTLTYLGELEFEGSVKGEAKEGHHLLLTFQTGLFSVKNDETKNILIRKFPDSEWYSIYRKSSLPTFDFSIENCDRLELILNKRFPHDNSPHKTCGDGITDKDEISKFLSDIRSQENADEAGLYDLVKKPDLMLENCYMCGEICGFYEEEPNLVFSMKVTSFNDLAYSVSLDGEEYVFPEEWFERLQKDN